MASGAALHIVFDHDELASLRGPGSSRTQYQFLARHSDIRLTLDRYTHVLGEQQVAAVNSLPDLSTDPKVAGA